MMSIPDFPLENVNGDGETALVVSFRDFVNYDDDDDEITEHFSYELVKKGACVEKVCFGGNTPLHCALEKSYIKVAKLLLDVGVDVNVPNDIGETPLDVALKADEVTEEVTALLMYGAQPSFKQYGTSVTNDAPFLVQESLFLYLCDEYSDVEIGLDVLLKLAETKSPLFNEIIKFSVEVKIWDYKLDLYFQDLCSMSVDYLKMIIENVGSYISESFGESSPCMIDMYNNQKMISIENLNVMVESNMGSNVIAFINVLHSGRLFKNLIGLGCGESTIEELYCFLLSYGLTCKEFDLQLIYKKFGYCELFKILLHMDVKTFDVLFNISVRQVFCSLRGEFNKRNIMAVFIYDVSMNLDKFLALPYCVRRTNIKGIRELFSHFAHPKLREMHYEVVDDQPAMESLPQVPLLVELSRNAFRKFFVEKFRIVTSRTFFTLLNCLPISPVHRRIITYETKLY